VIAADVPVYAGRTDEGRRIVIEVKDRRVALVHAGVDFYRCAQFGEVGPLRVHVRPAAAVGRTGRFSFSAGERAETVNVKGRITGRRMTGTLRVSGTIATGQECHSHTLRFSAPAG
jgi:hypothetical protein